MKKLLYIFAGLIALSGCAKFLAQQSQDLVVVKNAIELDEVLLGSGYMSGVKSVMSSMGTSKVSPWLNMIEDNINAVVEKNIYRVEIYNYYIEYYLFGYSTWQLDVTRSVDQKQERADDDTWNKLYEHINVLNVILSEAERIELPTDEDKLKAVKIKAEAHFLRAWYYLHLTNLYGDAYVPSTAKTTLGVPLKLTHYVEENVDRPTYRFPRATLTDLYAQIIKDLETSISLFSQTTYKTVKYRASQPAAQLLLSRVYLYMQDWENAHKVAGEFLKQNSILTNLSTFSSEDKVFLNTDNGEVIFSQGPLNLQKMFSARGGDYCVSRDLYDTYADNDLRKAIFFKAEENTDSICLSRKYKMGGTDVSRISDIFVLRNAEGYLNMAEACAMLNQPDQARKWLNILRANRIEEFDGQDIGATDIFEAIRNERRRELCFEGHRWFDLRRYAVLMQNSYKREIHRVFAEYASSYVNEARLYVLSIDDPAYTFQIPKSVTSVETDFPLNIRNKRDYVLLDIREPEPKPEPEPEPEPES